MDELFAPPGNAWVSVSPQLRRLRRTVVSGWAVLLAVGWLVASSLLGLGAGWAVVPIVVLMLLLALGWRLVARQTRAWGYAERDDDLYIKHGALFRELVAVPYGRMQFVDVKAGPFEQLYGIATVRLHTASPRTNARIPGLPTDEAARLRDRLTELGESRAAGL